MKRHSDNRPIAAVQPCRIEDDIRERAYALFEARGKDEGYDLEDWLRAEEEITGHKKDAAAA